MADDPFLSMSKAFGGDFGLGNERAVALGLTGEVVGGRGMVAYRRKRGLESRDKRGAKKVLVELGVWRPSSTLDYEKIGW